MSASLTPVSPDPLSAVATALLAQIGSLFPAASFEQRMMPAQLTLKNWTELSRRMPFVGLGWEGFTPTAPGTPGGASGTAHYSLFLAVKNANGAGARYFGDGVGLGLFAMASVAIAGLHRWKMASSGTVLVQKVMHGALDGADESIAMTVLSLDVVGVVVDIGGTIAGFTVADFKQLAATYTSALTGETLVADTYPVGNWS